MTKFLLKLKYHSDDFLISRNLIYLKILNSVSMIEKIKTSWKYIISRNSHKKSVQYNCIVNSKTDYIWETNYHNVLIMYIEK